MTTFNLVFLLANNNPEEGYSREDAKKLNGLCFPSYASFWRHYPDEENSDGESKVILKSDDDFCEEWNDTDEYLKEFLDTHYVAIVAIG